MPRSAEQQALIDKLIEFLKPYKGKTIGTDVLAAKIAEIYKGKLGKNSPAKQLANLRKSSPEIFKDVKIDYSIKGKGPWNIAWENDPKWRKFFKEKNPGVKWEDLTTEQRDIKRNTWKSYEVFKERSKVIPDNYIRLNDFAKKVGINPDTLGTIRTRESYKNLNSDINKYFKPKTFKKEVYFKDPSKKDIKKFNEFVQKNKQSGIKSMAEKKQAVSYEPIKSIHRELIKDPDATPRELAEAIYGKANAKNLRNVGNDASMYVEFLSGSRKVPGITAPTIKISEEILGNILMPGSGFFNFGNAERRNAMLKERDKILKITDPNNRLFTARNRLVKALRGRGFNVDEVMGLSATYERAPGYSELAQITTPEINFLKGNTIDKDFSRIFDKVIKGEQNLDSEIKKFNKDSRIFQKNFGVDTPIIEYTPGKKLDASKFIKHFDKLTPEAKANVSQLADQGIVLRSKAMPMIELFQMAKADAAANGPICRIVGAKQSGGSTVSCVDAVNEALEKNPKKLAQDINKSDAGGAFNKIKNSSTKFLTAIKQNPNLLRGGLPGKIALGLGTVAAGAGAGALVKQFKSDDPSTYLTDTGQMEGMLIADVEQLGEGVEDNIFLDNQFKLEAAAAAGLTAPIAKKVFQTARGVGEAGPLPEGVGRTRAALGLSKGVLGKGLWALGAPAVAIPSTIGYVAQDIRAGKDAEEIATNPLNYLGAAFMNPAVKALGRAGASRGLLGIASLGLAGTAALPALSIGAGLATLGTLGYQGYKLFTGRDREDGEFFR